MQDLLLQYVRKTNQEATHAEEAFLYQRDMMLLEQSKEELNLKTKTYELMNKSIQTTDNAMESSASSMTHLADNIKDGLALLAQSSAQNSSVNCGTFQQAAFSMVDIDLRNKTNF